MKYNLMIIASIFLLAGCDDRTAEQIGEDMAQEKVDMIKGAGEVVKEEGEDVANTVAQGVGNVVTGLTRGFDESLVQKEIRLDEALKPLLAVNRAQSIDSQPSEKRKGVSLYIVSEPGVKKKMILAAYAGGVEVGRSSAEVEIEKSGALYVDFEFDERTPLSSVEYFLLKPAG